MKQFLSNELKSINTDKNKINFSNFLKLFIYNIHIRQKKFLLTNYIRKNYFSPFAFLGKSSSYEKYFECLITTHF